MFVLGFVDDKQIARSMMHLVITSYVSHDFPGTRRHDKLSPMFSSYDHLL